MLAPLFLAPWAATCISPKIGLQVSLLFMAIHYGVRTPVLDLVLRVLNNKKSNYTVKKHAAQTQTERQTESSSGQGEGEAGKNAEEAQTKLNEFDWTARQ